MENDQPLGCAVCRVESGTGWCESLYVLPQARRRGIAAALFRQAEQFAETLGESMDYHYVHPNNHRIIAFPWGGAQLPLLNGNIKKTAAERFAAAASK